MAGLVLRSLIVGSLTRVAALGPTHGECVMREEKTEQQSLQTPRYSHHRSEEFCQPFGRYGWQRTACRVFQAMSMFAFLYTWFVSGRLLSGEPNWLRAGPTCAE